MKLHKVDPTHCDEMFILHIFSTGHWTNPYAELFAVTEEGEATHLHIYRKALAVEGFKRGKLKLPASVVSVSHAEDA